MAPTKHFLNVAQRAHHRNDVVLNVAEIDTDFATRGHTVLLVTAFCEAFDDVRFASEQAHHAEDILARFADQPEHTCVVIVSGNEDLIFNVLRLSFGIADYWGKGVDDVVTV